MEEFRGKTLLDIGSAEGFTALDTIEVTRFVYLFEYEDKWIEALQATFEPWKEKTMIVKKYISDHDDDVNAALDNFLKDKSRKDIFLKMDIEGAECMALQGCMELFAKADTWISRSVRIIKKLMSSKSRLFWTGLTVPIHLPMAICS